MNAPAKLAKPARRYAVRDALAPGLTWRGLVERAGPRPWLIRGLLMLAAVSLITGKGGVGKSMISLAIAMHYAAGLDLAPWWRVMKRVNGQPVKRKVLILAAEDTEDEMLRRMGAIGELFGLDYGAIAGRIKIVTPKSDQDEDTGGVNIKLFTKVDTTKRSGTRNDSVSTRQLKLNYTALGERLPKMVRDYDVDLVILDPIVEVHDAEENSNDEMNEVWKSLRYIARKCNVAILGVHH